MNPKAANTVATIVRTPHQLSTVTADRGSPKNHTLNNVKKNG
jgi:hypothetical protein